MSVVPLALLAWMAGSHADATEIGSRPFGLGVVIGDPTGLSAKLYLSQKNAIDFALAWDSVGAYHGWLYFHATYLWHPSLVATGPNVEIPWHIGVGGYVSDGRWGYHHYDYDTEVGARVPLGLDVNLDSVPLQFFGDIALLVGLVPDTYVDLSFGIGARYYF